MQCYNRFLSIKIVKSSLFLLSLMVMFLSFTMTAVSAQNVYPGKAWDKANTPEEVGWSSEKLELAKQYSNSINSLAVMIVQDGVVVSEWGETTKLNNIHSARKSLLSALYGIYTAEGKIDLMSTMEQLGIDDNEPALTPIEKQARVIDLLQARSGIYHPALYETAPMKAKRPARGSHLPGTFWYYNNWDFNALGTIFEKSTNLSVYQAFKTRIADPIGMEDYDLKDQEYFYGPDSIHPAYPFHMSARDLARFGLLFLHQGEWNGKQIVPKHWAIESTSLHSHGGPGTGYGYLWWTSVDGVHYDNKINGFSARGAGGQNIIIIPSLNLVVVHTMDREIAHKSIDKKQMGKLLKLILDAKNNS